MSAFLRAGLLAAGLLLVQGAAQAPIVRTAAAQPEYAKWGRIAMERTAEKYRLPIVDYLHVGRTSPSPGVAEEKFKLWLRGNGREFGVFVTIRFETATERILNVAFEETTR